MKNILVAGGAGFLGTNLCFKLLEDKNNIIYCLDNFYTSSNKNISELLKNERFVFIKDDIIDFKTDIHFDEIYNAACPASPKKYQKDPIYTINVNTNGVINLLNIAKRDNSKFLQFSTSEVYGNPSIHPQPESYLGNVNPDGIRACYDEGKRIAETICFEYNRLYDVEIKIIRIFNTYGPYMDKDDGRVISNFINQALRNEPITIYGKGFQTRSFCYVDDLIAGIISMMKTNKKITGPINLGNPEEYNMIELSQKIIKLTNSKSELVYNNIPKDDPVRRKPDIDKANIILDWNPVINLTDGLEKTINYFVKEKL